MITIPADQGKQRRIHVVYNQLRMDDLDPRRQGYTQGSGLGEALVPPVRVGECEVSLHRQVRPDPLWALMEQDQQDEGPVKWYLFSFPDETDDDPQGEPSEQVFSAPRGEVPEALREVWGDRPTTPPPPTIGGVVSVTVCPDGSISQGGPVPFGVSGTICEGGTAVHGPLPKDAVSVEANAGEESVPVHVGQGVFLTAVSSGVDLTIIFRDPQGDIVEERHMQDGWLD